MAEIKQQSHEKFGTGLSDSLIVRHYTDNSTEAILRMGEIIVRGYAKHNPIDHYEEALGKQIALGRAIEKLGRKVTNRGKEQALTIGAWKGYLRDVRKLKARWSLSVSSNSQEINAKQTTNEDSDEPARDVVASMSPV